MAYVYCPVCGYIIGEYDSILDMTDKKAQGFKNRHKCTNVRHKLRDEVAPDIEGSLRTPND